MILKLPANPEVALKRLRMGGLSFDGPEEAIIPEDAGVKLGGKAAYEQEDGILTVPVVLTLSKNMVFVAVNPQLGEILGYQPGAPQSLTADYFGQVELAVGPDLTEAQLAEIDQLEWLVQLHYVTVGGMD